MLRRSVYCRCFATFMYFVVSSTPSLVYLDFSISGTPGVSSAIFLASPRLRDLVNFRCHVDP